MQKKKKYFFCVVKNQQTNEHYMRDCMPYELCCMRIVEFICICQSKSRNEELNREKNRKKNQQSKTQKLRQMATARAGGEK